MHRAAVVPKVIAGGLRVCADACPHFHEGKCTLTCERMAARVPLCHPWYVERAERFAQLCDGMRRILADYSEENRSGGLHRLLGALLQQACETTEG
jgi:hypothetical protein